MDLKKLCLATLLGISLVILPVLAEDSNSTETATTVATTEATTVATTETTATPTTTATTVSAPTAAFIMNSTSGTEPLSVRFTDYSTNTPTSWYWDFGDGNTSTTQNPVHTYAFNGTFSVSLTATNSGGSNTLTYSDIISVAGDETDTSSATEPVAEFSVNLTSGSAPLSIQFTDGSSNTPTSWYWLFGDGEYDNVNQSPTHTYTSAGTYTITFTATNSAGSNTTTATITVTEATATATTTATTVTTTVATTSTPVYRVTTVATVSVAKSATGSASDFLAEQKAAREAADAEAAATESPLPVDLVLGAIGGGVIAIFPRK